MKKQEDKQGIKQDTRNYRIHGDENKRIIKKSLKELGAGRSILLDNEIFDIEKNRKHYFAFEIK